MITNMTGFRCLSKIFASLCFGIGSLSIGMVRGNPYTIRAGLDKAPSPYRVDITSCVDQAVVVLYQVW